MPCIVPDTKDIAAIPNAMPSDLFPFKNTMPNVVPRIYKVFPEIDSRK